LLVCWFHFTKHDVVALEEHNAYPTAEVQVVPICTRCVDLFEQEKRLAKVMNAGKPMLIPRALFRIHEM